MKNKRYSIKQRLLKHILITVLFIALGSLIAIYLDAKHEVEELFDASLAQSSRVLMGLVEPETIKQNKDSLHRSLDIHDIDFSLYDRETTPYGHKYEKKLAFQVWDKNGELLLKSASIDEQALAPLALGFTYQQRDDYQWRTFTQYSEHSQLWLIVGERDDIRGELTHAIAVNHILPFFFIIPLLGGLIWLTIERGIAPLQSIVHHVEKQHYEKLKTIHKDNIPQEVNSLTEAINHLFQRLNQSYQREQRFTADVAHELRNPLAALQIHNDNARAENKDAELAGSLENISKSIERLSHLVLQLLALSRADRGIACKEYVQIDLILLCQGLQQSYQAQAAHKHQQLSFSSDLENASVLGIETLLESLLSNLIDNALRYSPENAQVRISCQRENEQFVLSVEDSGEGIPDALRQRVYDRFYRVPGTQQQGSGLGLSIVQRIAETHAIDMQLLSSRLGGLQVRLVFKVLLH